MDGRGWPSTCIETTTTTTTKQLNGTNAPYPLPYFSLRIRPSHYKHVKASSHLPQYKRHPHQVSSPSFVLLLLPSVFSPPLSSATTTRSLGYHISSISSIVFSFSISFEKTFCHQQNSFTSTHTLKSNVNTSGLWPEKFVRNETCFQTL